MHQALEHQEHAEHAAEHGNKRAALLVAILAACLAITEQQAKHAEILVDKNSILAADAWNQYQAKSIRETLARDVGQLASSLDAPSQPDLAARRAEIIKSLKADELHYAKDERDGKEVIAARAHAFEEARDFTLERSHTFDNAAAVLELGIVLATVSAITASKMLIRLALGLGALGVVLGVLGVVAPSLGAF
jgi:hypothetical protein